MERGEPVSENCYQENKDWADKLSDKNHCCDKDANNGKTQVSVQLFSDDLIYIFAIICRLIQKARTFQSKESFFAFVCNGLAFWNDRQKFCKYNLSPMRRILVREGRLYQSGLHPWVNFNNILEEANHFVKKVQTCYQFHQNFTLGFCTDILPPKKFSPNM